jgi:hypothetical protein
MTSEHVPSPDAGLGQPRAVLYVFGGLALAVLI